MRKEGKPAPEGSPEPEPAGSSQKWGRVLCRVRSGAGWWLRSRTC